MPRITDANKKRFLKMLLLSTLLLGNFISLLYVSFNEPIEIYYDRPESVVANFPLSTNTSVSNTEKLGYIDDGQISLQWFLHVTDVHFHDNISAPEVEEYARFLNWSYDVIHPLSLVLTGDLIMGQRNDNLVQLPERVVNEYKTYWTAVNQTPYFTDPNPFRYLETPGNHDRNSDWGAQLFLNYTMTGNKLGSLQTFYRANFSQYSLDFALLDSSPIHATPTFFGSEGHLDTTDLEEYRDFLIDHEDDQHIFFFLHQHPLEDFGVIPPGEIDALKNVNSLSKEYHVDAAFYGHTHMDFNETYHDIVYLMGDRFKDRYTDENGDEIQFNYRIVAVDGKGMNCESAHFTNLPQAIITNPVNPLFLDEYDNLSSTRGDGHVRALVFPNQSDPIHSVQYRVDANDWKEMTLYPNSTLLYETPRMISGMPYTAIPQDSNEHNVDVRITSQSGKIVIFSATVTREPMRAPFFQSIFYGLELGLIGIIIFINRDNYPLKRSDGKRRPLTHNEKVIKRDLHYKKEQRPWWLTSIAWAWGLAFIFMPWGVFPLIQGRMAISWAGLLYTPDYGIFFMIEGLLYLVVRLVLILPMMVWGVKSYHPNVVFFAGFLMCGDVAFLMIQSYNRFLSQGFFLPGVYFELILGFVIMIGTFKQTKLGKLIFKSRKNQKLV